MEFYDCITSGPILCRPVMLAVCLGLKRGWCQSLNRQCNA